jgi:hypothetical protein
VRSISASWTIVPHRRAEWRHACAVIERVRQGAFALWLQRGEVYDVNRMVVEFTMLNPGKVLLCAVSTAAMHDLEGRRDVKPNQRAD